MSVVAVDPLIWEAFARKPVKRGANASGGDRGILFASPLATTLWTLIAFSLALPLILRLFRRPRT